MRIVHTNSNTIFEIGFLMHTPHLILSDTDQKYILRPAEDYNEILTDYH